MENKGYQSHKIQKLYRTQTIRKYHTRTNIGRLSRSHTHTIIIHPAHRLKKEHHRQSQERYWKNRRISHPCYQ